MMMVDADGWMDGWMDRCNACSDAGVICLISAFQLIHAAL